MEHIKREKSCSEICLIAPSEELGTKARTIIRERRENIDVYISSLDDATTVAAGLMERGARIFISRKGTKTLLEDTLNATVVGIPTILSDYLEIMKKVRLIDSPVAFFSYDELTNDVKTMCELLDIHWRWYRFTGSLSAEESVKRAIEDGAVCGIGGVVTEIPALKLGLPYMPIESSAESVISSIETAKQILAIQKQEEVKQEYLKINLERYQTVTDFSRDGILVLDWELSISVANPAAERLLELKAEKLLGRKVSEVIPAPKLAGLLNTEKKRVDEVVRFNHTYLTVDTLPITVDGKQKGVVIILRDVKSLQKSEQKVRLGLHKKELVAKYFFDNIIAGSDIMERVIKRAKKFASVDATVLITGETGTGKELFAQSIHNGSERKTGPFVAINCASLDKSLMESELFGYEEGTFTGALKGGKAGLFEMAHGGTIFLDEIGEIPFNVQAQLLRILQEREVRRMGSSTVIPVDVRVIVATNRNLGEEVKKGGFRQDLYYRLNILNLHIPPLRERGQDMRLIALSMFSGKLSELGYTLPEKTIGRILDYMEGYAWPGNVRELSNFVECISVLSQSSYEEMAEYMDGILGQAPPKAEAHGKAVGEISAEIQPDEASESDSGNLKHWEKQRIETALKENGLSTGRTAAALGMSRSTLWRKMREYGLHS